MDPIIFPILRQLDGDLIRSVKFLAHKLGVSSDRVLSALQDSQSLRLDIQRINSCEYLWRDPVIWLNGSLIKSNILHFPASFSIETVDMLTSTNSCLLERSLKKYPNSNQIPVLAAELQTSGRGRRGRRWHSGLGESLLFSFAWHFKKSALSLSGLSLVIGIAIVRALRTLNISNIQLKWPNDVLYGSRKLAGILIEAKAGVLNSSIVVIGVGLNVKLSAFTRSVIGDSVCDIFDITGCLFDRNVLLAVFLSEIRQILLDFERYGFSYYKNEWETYHSFNGMPVVLKLSEELVYEGIFDGIEDDGSIILATPNGKRHFNIGEVSLRPK